MTKTKAGKLAWPKATQTGPSSYTGLFASKSTVKRMWKTVYNSQDMETT